MMQEGIITEESQMIRKTGLFWRIIRFFLTLTGLIVAINYIFRFRLLGILDFDVSYIYLLFACFLSQVFIIFPANKAALEKSIPWYDVLLFSLTFTINIYLATRAYEICFRAWDISPPLYIGILACILNLLVLEALRRIGNIALFLIVLFFAIYPTFAGYMPGLLRGVQLSFWEVAVFSGLTTQSVIGILMKIYGDILIGFLVFGAVLLYTGGAQAFMDFSMALLGTHKGGPAKVAVLASGLFGTLSGSVISNIITTGSFTIPSMKKAGYSPSFAAATEVCASTGGNIMPPVMGSAAFIMASFLGITYFSVCKAAVMPALLYYFGTFIQVHMYAEKHNLIGYERINLPSIKHVLKNNWFYFFAIISLVYFLYIGLEGRAPFITSIILILLAMLRKEKRAHLLKNFLDFFENMGEILVTIIGIMAGIGYIVGTFAFSGIGSSLSSEFVQLAGGNIFLILFFSALVAIILGMGMPVVACYIFLSIILAPGLVKLGITPIAAHLYLFYFSLASYLTPPVALGVTTAIAISRSDFSETALEALKLGFVVYLVPIFFVFVPSLLFRAPLIEMIFPLFTMILSIILIASSFQGYFFKVGSIGLFYRILFLAIGLLVMIPNNPLASLVGIVFFLIVLFVLFLKKGGKQYSQ